MSFREKSAWVMAVITGLAGLYYLQAAVSAPSGALPTGTLRAYVCLVVVASVLAQTGLAIFWPKEAVAGADERERPLLDRAGHWSGTILGAGAVTSLLHFLVHRDPNLLFHSMLGSLIVAQVAGYGFQIALLRRGL